MLRNVEFAMDRCICLFLPLHRRPSPNPAHGSASRIVPQRDFVRLVFRDRRHSLRSGLLVCSPPRSPLPLRPKRPQGSRDFSTRATHASLPMPASGMLAVRIRQLTAVGLSPPKTCSLVGRYPGFEPATLRLTATHGASSSPSLGTETGPNRGGFWRGGKIKISRALPRFAALCRPLRPPAKNLAI